MFLAGDIGGTKTDLAIFTRETGPRTPIAQAEFPSRKYPSLEAVVQEFLGQTRFPIEYACFDVAGPVVEERVKVTNLPWTIEEKVLTHELGLKRVRLMNDLEAIAHAIPILQSEDLRSLSSGTPVPGGTIAVVAPGTGLGEAFLVWDGASYRAYPSEGGHTDFAPTDAHQAGILAYLSKSYDHVSVERVCSGLGIPNIYHYFRDSGFASEPPDLAAAIAAATDPTPIIVDRALADGEAASLCRATVDTFVTILGAEAGNLALKVLATGGVYLAGGIPKRILPLLEDGRLVEAFRRKGRFTELLSSVPVQVVLAQAALIGAARCAIDLA